MPTVWIALKKSLNCKSEGCDVHEEAKNGKGTSGGGQELGSISTKRSTGWSSSSCSRGCSRSIANLRDVIHGGSRRHTSHERQAATGSCSPRSIGSNDLLNPITHEVVLSGSKCELRISGVDSAYVGTLSPGGCHCHSPLFLRCSTTPVRNSPGMLLFDDAEQEEQEESSSLSQAGFRNAHRPLNSLPPRASCEVGVQCHRCGERFAKSDALDAHHLSKHAVSELVEGDSSRRIVEIICKAGWPKSDNAWGRIDRVLKVHNVQSSLVRFEEFREMVKTRAAKLPKKHPRCLADGNELLRFFGTTVSCSLGVSGSSSLCTSTNCNICRIIKHGFSANKEVKGGIGVFTTSTSKRALECIQGVDGDDPCLKKALLVCRVIAGRMHKPMESLQDFAGQPGFDSVAGKVGLYSNIEELYLLNPRALLPCFVVICKP